MTRSASIAGRWAVAALWVAAGSAAIAQDPLVVRPPPAPLEDFEADGDGDGVPDGWYNTQEVAVAATGGVVGPRCLRFEATERGLPSRASRAFGVDGRATEAIVIGLWVRAEGVRSGDRLGADPSMLVEFIGEDIRPVRRATLGPWKRTPGNAWVRVAARLPIPETTRDVITTVGLLGATGVLEIDGVTIDLVPRGGRPTTDLILNGDFELGTIAEPAHWAIEGGARRVHPGRESSTAVELPRSGAKAMTALGVPTGPFGAVEVSLRARGQGLRSDGAQAVLYFLDADGRPINQGGLVGQFSGSFGWVEARREVKVPSGAERVVLQVEHVGGGGSLKVDDVSVVAAPDPGVARWSPYRVRTDGAADWPEYRAAPAVEAGSALDASALLAAPAGRSGFVGVEGGHLAFKDGSRARFFGVVALPPLGFLPGPKADALADRLARSGVNLVRFDDLDVALGPGRSLIDDARDDTTTLDPAALARFDHLVAALKARGIYVSLEAQAARIYRAGDGLADAPAFPVGGGPALAFDPRLRGLAVDLFARLLAHVNPETGLALKDDPALAWVAISGEQSLFDLADDPEALPAAEAALLRSIAEKRPLGAGPRLWQALEAEQWKAAAEALRGAGLRVPIAGCSHWRREPEFAAAQAGAGLDLIDDRLYWSPPAFGDPARRSMLYNPRGSIRVEAAKKRRPGRPYVAGQWCDHTSGAWAQPFEAADMLFAAHVAAADDWDGLARRGLFSNPEVWGASATGTGGDRDVVSIPEVLNGNPAAFSMLPHAASIVLQAPAARPARGKAGLWDPKAGRLAVETPRTIAVAGWSGRQGVSADGLTLRVDSPYGVLAASSVDAGPLATSRRLLVSAIARVEPTGLRWSDASRRVVGDPGVAPLRQEPIRAAVTWKRPGTPHAYALDASGRRAAPLPPESTPDGPRWLLDGSGATVHWEITAD